MVWLLVRLAISSHVYVPFTTFVRIIYAINLHKFPYEFWWSKDRRNQTHEVPWCHLIIINSTDMLMVIIYIYIYVYVYICVCVLRCAKASVSLSKLEKYSMKLRCYHFTTHWYYLISAAVCLKGKNTWHAPETCHGFAKQSCAVIAGASPRTNVDTLNPELAILPVKRVFAYTAGISIYKLNAPRFIPRYVYVYNDHLMGYFFAFWSSSRWPRVN